MGMVVCTGCTSTSQAPESPAPATSSPSAATPTVQRVDFSPTYRLDAIVRDGTVVLQDVPTGTSFVATAKPNAAVSQGATIGRLESTPAAATESDTPKSVADSNRGRAEQWLGPLAAPVAGRFTLHQGRPAVVANGVDIVAALTPLQEMRYRSLRYLGQATIETPFGPRESPCRALWLDAAPATAARSQASGSEDTETSAVAGRLHCRLPGWAETAAGMRAQLTLRGVTVKDALVVPAIAVSYDPKTDQPFVTTVQGTEPKRVEVELGATDGVLRVVTGELTPGQNLRLASAS